MNILLTGANGFTGRHFAEHARQAGHSITALEVDLRDTAAVSNAVLAADFEAVVHLAAISFVGHADNTAFYGVNVVGTTNLLQALAAAGKELACVLVASSANVYGNCTASPISEEQAPAPVNHYAASKLAMEHLAMGFSDRLPIVVTRPFNYTGRGQAAQFLIPKLVSHFAKRAPHIELGNLDVEREFNDVRMVCDAYLKLLKKGTSGQIYNVCSGHPHTLKSVIATLEELTKHSMEVRVNPAFVRANEVHRLCGNPLKLIDRIGPANSFQLPDTLQWMLEVPS